MSWYATDDDDDWEFDCGAVFSGGAGQGDGEFLGCQMAGSEGCEFDCPYRAEFYGEIEETPDV